MASDEHNALQEQVWRQILDALKRKNPEIEQLSSRA